MKKVISLLLVFVLAISCFAGCKAKDPVVEDNSVEAIIAKAQTMTRDELYAKAIEEWDGKTINCVGNSSRGKTAFEYFVAYLQGKSFDATTKTYVADEKVRKEFPKFKEDFSGKYTWGQPKNNNIFGQIAADVKASSHTLSMVLIQDGNQIQSKMLDTGMLLNYIPKEWAGDVDKNGVPFALQSLNKVFMFNNLGKEVDFNNCWDFVKPGNAPLFMGVDSEPVGKNFLYMLTNEHYSNILKDAYDKLSDAEKALFEDTLKEVEPAVKELNMTHANAKYSLAWIQRWVKQFNQQTDDGPICNELVKKSAEGKNGLLVYSKLRSVTESDDVSKKNITIAAYQDGYAGIGGYMYKHYLQVLKTSPMPWTSCAFIHYMTTTKEGFAPWGKDIGGY
ncbi:MAG: hypothetical protein RR107_01500, partial [Clostridia bacterium]